MTELSYGEFSAALHRRTAAGRVAAHASVEVTHRCPLACGHCYNNLPMGDLAAGREELTTAEHFRLVDEMAALGTLWLLYTGGEIFARPDFLDIYRYARERGFLITLFTNGTLITPRIAGVLAEHRPFSVEITLYGATERTYEELTGVPGSYARCFRGIDLLLERNIPLKLKAVAVSMNRHELPAMRELARQRGLSFHFDAQMNPRTDCSQQPLAVRLSPEEVVRLDLADPARSAALRAQLAAAGGQPVERERLYRCGGGLDSFAIDPYGAMTLCVLSAQDRYDWRRGSLREGWERFLGEVRNRRRTRPARCAECGLQAICGTCPAVSHLETGDPEQPVDFLCQVTHLRAHALGVDIPAHRDCPCCPGGARHESVLASAGRLRQPSSSSLERAFIPLTVLGSSSNACAGCS